MSRKYWRALLLVGLIAVTVATAWLWLGILRTPLGRSNTVELVKVSALAAGAIFSFGAALKRLPESVRPAGAYSFAFEIYLAVALCVAIFTR